MAWTTPKTWSDADVPSGSDFNTYLRDNLLYLYSPPRCRVRRGSEQGIANNTETNIEWDHEDFDTDGFHSTSSNTDRITIPTGLGGSYFIACHVSWSQGLVAGIRQIKIARRSSGGGDERGMSIRIPTVNTVDIHQSLFNCSPIQAGHWIECKVLQNSGSSLNVRSDDRSPVGAVHWVGG